MEGLIKGHQVDLTGFDFDRYFPPEFPGRTFLETLLLWIIPFAGDIARRCAKYRPFTLAMLDRVISTKHWKASNE